MSCISRAMPGPLGGGGQPGLLVALALGPRGAVDERAEVGAPVPHAGADEAARRPRRPDRKTSEPTMSPGRGEPDGGEHDPELEHRAPRSRDPAGLRGGDRVQRRPAARRRRPAGSPTTHCTNATTALDDEHGDRERRRQTSGRTSATSITHAQGWSRRGGAGWPRSCQAPARRRAGDERRRPPSGEPGRPHRRQAPPVCPSRPTLGSGVAPAEQERAHQQRGGGPGAQHREARPRARACRGRSAPSTRRPRRCWAGTAGRAAARTWAAAGRGRAATSSSPNRVAMPPAVLRTMKPSPTANSAITVRYSATPIDRAQGVRSAQRGPVRAEHLLAAAGRRRRPTPSMSTKVAAANTTALPASTGSRRGTASRLDADHAGGVLAGDDQDARGRRWRAGRG